jgi:hypothetical protein
MAHTEPGQGAEPDFATPTPTPTQAGAPGADHVGPTPASGARRGRPGSPGRPAASSKKKDRPPKGRPGTPRGAVEEAKGCLQAVVRTHRPPRRRPEPPAPGALGGLARALLALAEEVQVEGVDVAAGRAAERSCRAEEEGGSCAV